MSELKAGHSVVVDDMRFYQEYDLISGFESGVTVKMVRHQAVRTNSHSSEGALDGVTFDYIISNYGDLAYLKDVVDEMMEHYK
jgi:predicted TIM-barrel enzyme